MLNVVTGGAGFLGSHLVDALLKLDDEVVIIDDLSTGALRNVQSATESGKAAFLYLNVARPLESLHEPISKAIDGRMIGRIFHLASPASPEAYGAHPWETLAVNSIGTMAMIDLALEHGARFIYSSTSEIYGDPLMHPQPESYFGNVDPIGPRSCYDEGKRFGEAAVAAAVRARGLDARLARFFNCYGPRMELGDGRLIPALMQAVMEDRPLPVQGTGAQTRSMTYVDDAIGLLMVVAKADLPVLQPVNIGSDDERSVGEIASAVARVSGKSLDVVHLPAREGDPQRRRPDLTVARNLGWMPSTPLDAGLRKTLDWFAGERMQFA